MTVKQLTLTVAGKAAPLLPRVAKESGNTYYVIAGQPQAARFGIKVPEMSKGLPASVEIDGVTIPLAHKVRERDGKATAGNHSAKLTVDGADKTAKVVITDHGDGTWQITAAVFGSGKGGGNAVNTSLFS